MGKAIPGQRQIAGNPFTPDYSVFSDHDHPIYHEAQKTGKTHIVSKEEFGNWKETGTKQCNPCNFRMFPDDGVIRDTKPIFTIRDPESNFDSWLSKGWDDFDSFSLAYNSTLKTYKRAKEILPETILYSFESITRLQQQETIFQAICEYWSLEYSPTMFSFDAELPKSFIYRDEEERRIYSENPRGIFDTLLSSKTILPEVATHGLVTEEHRRRIKESGLLQAYQEAHEACQRWVSAIRST